MSEVRIVIGAEDKAQATFKSVEVSAKSAFSSIENSAVAMSSRTSSAFDGLSSKSVSAISGLKDAVQSASDTINKSAGLETLGIKTAAAMEAQKATVNAAYQSIKNSGVATAEEITRAERARVSAIEKIDQDNFATRTSLLDGLKQHWVAVAAVIVTAWGVIQNVVDPAVLAARVETLGVVLNVVGRNAGNSATQMKGYVDQVKAMGITTEAAMTSVTRMTQAQMDLSKSGQLARIAQDAAVIGNINSSEALERMTFGIQSAQIEVLRTIGINVNFEQSYAKLAKQLGKSIDALSEQEKVTARTNAVLDQGKMIAGAYAGAMDTVGKQALSLSRYSEEAQLKLGELFKPTYAALVTLATNALAGLNIKLDELNKNGTLAEWGQKAASAFMFLANNSLPLVAAALVGLATQTGITGKAFVSMITALEACGASLKAMGAIDILLQPLSVTLPKIGSAIKALNFSSLGTSISALATSIGSALPQMGASISAFLTSGPMAMLLTAGAAFAGFKLGEWIQLQGPEARQEKETNAWIDETKDFLQVRWYATQRLLEESGIKGMLSPKALADAMKAGDIVKYTVKVGENVDLDTGAIADVIQTRYKNVRNELQITKEQIEATTKGFAEMASIVDKMGGMNLRMGSDTLHMQISANVLDMRALSTTYQNLSDTVKAGFELDRQIDQVGTITRAFSQYGETIDSVYSGQLRSQRDILEEMRLYETKQSNIMKQAVNVTETEIKYNEAKLANYRSYYDELQKMQKIYYDTAVKAAQELVRIEKAAVADRVAGQRALYEAWNKANPATNEMEAFSRQYAQIQQRMAYATSLSAAEQIKEFEAIRQELVNMSKNVSWTESMRQFVIPDKLGQSAEFVTTEVTKMYNTFETTGPLIQAINERTAQLYAQQAEEAQNMGKKAVEALSSISDAMKIVDSAIKETQSTIITLDKLLAQQRTLTIDVSGALSGLRQIVDYQNQISGFSDSQLSGKASVVSTGSGSAVFKALDAEVAKPRAITVDTTQAVTSVSGLADQTRALPTGGTFALTVEGTDSLSALQQSVSALDTEVARPKVLTIDTSRAVSAVQNLINLIRSIPSVSVPDSSSSGSGNYDVWDYSKSELSRPVIEQNIYPLQATPMMTTPAPSPQSNQSRPITVESMQIIIPPGTVSQVKDKHPEEMARLLGRYIKTELKRLDGHS